MGISLGETGLCYDLSLGYIMGVLGVQEGVQIQTP